MTSSERIQYRLLWGVSRVAGWLPRGLLYRGFAPMVCWVLHRVVRYRVSVVRTNLANAFPEKSREELRDIERRFYRHLSEVFIDTILLGSISRREILERMVYRDVEKQEELMRGRSWISAMSHFGSWELTINYVCHTDHRVFAVYRPLHNAVVDRFYHSARSRFGTQPVPMNDIFKETIAARLIGREARNRRADRRPDSSLARDQALVPFPRAGHSFLLGHREDGPEIENARLFHARAQGGSPALRSRSSNSFTTE